MIGATRFSNFLHRLVLEAFSAPEASPETIAEYFINRIPVRAPWPSEIDGLQEFLQSHSIRELVHFTPTLNVPNIFKYGLIPRDHLAEKAVQIVLNPIFTDDYRWDEIPQVNCISITDPNYKMFFRKRMEIRGSWTVLKINPSVLLDCHFSYTVQNAATKGEEPVPGTEGIRRLFLDEKLRERLGLTINMTTNPQSEVLGDSVIKPKYIEEALVDTPKALNWLKRRGIPSRIDRNFFLPRKDYKYWQSNNSQDR